MEAHRSERRCSWHVVECGSGLAAYPHSDHRQQLWRKHAGRWSPLTTRRVSSPRALECSCRRKIESSTESHLGPPPLCRVRPRRVCGHGGDPERHQKRIHDLSQHSSDTACCHRTLDISSGPSRPSIVSKLYALRLSRDIFTFLSAFLHAPHAVAIFLPDDLVADEWLSAGSASMVVDLSSSITKKCHCILPTHCRAIYE